MIYANTYANSNDISNACLCDLRHLWHATFGYVEFGSLITSSTASNISFTCFSSAVRIVQFDQYSQIFQNCFRFVARIVATHCYHPSILRIGFYKIYEIDIPRSISCFRYFSCFHSTVISGNIGCWHHLCERNMRIYY